MVDVRKDIEGRKDMFYVVAVVGCEPYVSVVSKSNGTALAFRERRKAETWARKNCAWEWCVVQF